MPPRRPPERVVVDTHTWLWAVAEPSKIGRRGRALIDGATEVLVPAISVWECAQLVAERRIALDRPVDAWVNRVLASWPYVLAPLTPEVATTAADLGPRGFHPDPADRLIYATAAVASAPLVTGDARIAAFEDGLPVRASRLVVW